jgi:phage terminase small subunit
MPRKSAADIAIPTGATPRLRPPDDLAAGSPERALFVDLVSSVAASHFRDCDAVLLAAYCRALCLEQTASSELAASGFVIDGKPSGWLPILAQATRSVTVLSSKLKLNPLSRLSSSSEPDQISYYEKMALQDHRDDAAN